MKHILAFIKAHLGLGWLGVVLLLMAAIVVVAGFFQLNSSFDNAVQRLNALTLLENDVQEELDWIKLYEAYYIFSVLYDEEVNQEYLAGVQEAHTDMDASLQELRASYFTSDTDYSPESLQMLDGFDNLRKAHQATFQAIVDAAAQGAAPLAVRDQYVAAKAEYDAMDNQLSALVQTLEEERLQEQQKLPGEVMDAIFVFSAGILLVILLGLWGYRLLFRYTEPLPVLRNAILAISGDRYRPELLAGLLKKPGPAGEAARSLHGLALHRQTHEQAEKDEIERLRQALFESRRKRLRISRPSQGQEVQK